MLKIIKNISLFAPLLSLVFTWALGAMASPATVATTKSSESSPRQPAWLEKASGLVRAYAGSTLQYYENNQTGGYHGLDLSLGYTLPAKTRFGSSLGIERNPDQYRDDDLNHSKNEYQISDLNLSFAAPEVLKFEERRLTVGSSLTGFYPMSRSSREHDLYTTLSNAWDLRWGRENYSFGIRASYSKNFYKYTEQMQEVRRGDLLGTSHIDQFMNAGLSASYKFDFGLNASAFYGVSRFYPYQGEFFHVNSSQLSVNYAIGSLTPYASLRTAASQLNHDNRINYAVFERNRSKGELGLTYSF